MSFIPLAKLFIGLLDARFGKFEQKLALNTVILKLFFSLDLLNLNSFVRIITTVLVRENKHIAATHCKAFQAAAHITCDTVT